MRKQIREDTLNEKKETRPVENIYVEGTEEYYTFNLDYPNRTNRINVIRGMVILPNANSNRSYYTAI